MQSSRYNREGVSAVTTKAYILIETAVSRNREIIAALKKLQGINSVELVTGPYDIIAVVEAAITPSAPSATISTWPCAPSAAMPGSRE